MDLEPTWTFTMKQKLTNTRGAFSTLSAPAQKYFTGCDGDQQGLRNEAQKGEQTGGR